MRTRERTQMRVGQVSEAEHGDPMNELETERSPMCPRGSSAEGKLQRA